MTAGGSASGLGARLASVRERVERAATRAGRDPSDVCILAVTKGHPLEVVRAALDAGLRDIGESRVQEAQAKRAEVGGGAARWHMVGHVQRNKARAAAALFDVVHSVDSGAVAAALARHRPSGVPPLRVLVEIELTGLDTRSGVSPQAAAPLLEELVTLPTLEPLGLMTVAPPNPMDARRCFAMLRALRDELSARSGIALPELSMGMSGDFEDAIAEGATIVRLGTVLFGSRATGGVTAAGGYPEASDAAASTRPVS